MRRIQRRRDLRQQFQSPLGVKPAGPDDQVPQVGAVHQVHRQEEHSVVLTRVVDRHDVGMVQRGGDPGLAPEPLPKHVVLSQFRGEHLERIYAIECGVGRAIDHPHPPTADQIVDAVAADERARL